MANNLIQTDPAAGQFKRYACLAFSALLLAVPPASSGAQSSAPQDTVLHIEVRRIPLDIVVTDKNGNPVRGLKQEDFIIKIRRRRRLSASIISTALQAPLSLQSSRRCLRIPSSTCPPSPSGDRSTSSITTW